MSEYYVNYWGSYPGENDDLNQGFDFTSSAPARELFDSEITSPSMRACTAYIELTGPGVYELRKNPHFRPSKDDYSDLRREQAMQAGMGMGIDAYNDYMGY